MSYYLLLAMIVILYTLAFMVGYGFGHKEECSNAGNYYYQAIQVNDERV